MRYPPRGPWIEEAGRRGDDWAWLHHLLGLLIVAAAIVAIVVLVLRYLDRRATPAVVTTASVAPSPIDDAALAAVRLRYAQGDLSREDYLRMSSDLGASVPTASSTEA